jgi:hypothetical protein
MIPRTPGKDFPALTEELDELQTGKIQPRQYKNMVKFANLTSSGEPNNLDEALTNKNWRNAMNEEYLALIENKTWHLVSP